MYRDWRNGEGYWDPTAGEAIDRVMRERGDADNFTGFRRAPGVAAWLIVARGERRGGPIQERRSRKLYGGIPAAGQCHRGSGGLGLYRRPVYAELLSGRDEGRKAEAGDRTGRKINNLKSFRNFARIIFLNFNSLNIRICYRFSHFLRKPHTYRFSTNGLYTFKQPPYITSDFFTIAEILVSIQASFNEYFS